ncbi:MULTISPECIES: hypothetical protein [unclassified Pseudomonas]|uniref:hypothetical protein n=1 Tax=unclassified Pseudomonas TaxID=196821 RepID=UPI000BE41A88|nr:MULTISPECIES: hypothetical protein [unclassified Pseudomonas]PXX61440.1 hypothetical protein H160_04339 [Pseudomonas sp. LAMO17WK12:I9]
MHIDDTDDWLGIPTPLEIATQHGELLENKIQELTTQLRAAREKIFKLVNMHAKAEAERDEVLARLRERAGEAARMRKKIASLELSVRSMDRTNEDLRKLIRPEDMKRFR